MFRCNFLSCCQFDLTSVTINSQMNGSETFLVWFVEIKINCCHIYGRFCVHGQNYGQYFNFQSNYLVFLSSVGKKTALLVFLALAFVSEKTKCAVCVVGFLYVAQRPEALRSVLHFAKPSDVRSP